MILLGHSPFVLSSSSQELQQRSGQPEVDIYSNNNKVQRSNQYNTESMQAISSPDRSIVVASEPEYWQALNDFERSQLASNNGNKLAIKLARLVRDDIEAKKLLDRLTDIATADNQRQSSNRFVDKRLFYDYLPNIGPVSYDHYASRSGTGTNYNYNSDNNNNRNWNNVAEKQQQQPTGRSITLTSRPIEPLSSMETMR